MRINRRQFLTALGAGLLAGCLGDIKKTPGVLLILVDSLSDWTGCLGGHPDARTPNIDGLAQRGMLFTNAHSVGTNSNASRTALFTGKHPISSGIYTDPTNYREVYPDLVTLPQYFQEARFTVQGSGRLFQVRDDYSWQDSPFFPFENRFVTDNLNGINFGPNFDWGALDIPDTDMHDRQVTDWAVNRITNLENPFFLGVGLSTTRFPLYLPPDAYHRFDPAQVTLPSENTGVLPPYAEQLITNNGRHRAVLEHDAWREAVAAYLSCMSYVDDLVGRIITAMDDSALFDETIIILAGTQGVHLGDKKYWMDDTLWEQLTRVPLMIAAPGMQAGVCSRAVSLLDIYPTVLDIWGGEAPQKLDGHSLLPLLEKPDAEWDFPVVMARRQGDYAVRDDRWRYIRYQDGGEELYEYIGDPDELHNLAFDPAYERRIEALRSFLPASDETAS